MRPSFLTCKSVALLSMLAGWSACDAPPPPTSPVTTSSRRVEDVQPTVVPTLNGELKQRQVAFLNRLRAADPQEKTIDRAMLNEQNELGLILDRSVDLEKIPALMRSMLTQMAKEFPGQDLTVIAYTPSNPPHKIGTGRLNAETRDLTYTPEG